MCELKAEKHWALLGDMVRERVSQLHINLLQYALPEDCHPGTALDQGGANQEDSNQLKSFSEREFDVGIKHV